MMARTQDPPRSEIERRFLVTEEFEPPPGVRSENFRQGYLSTDYRRVVRMRVEGGRALLTIKGEKVGALAPEFEYEIGMEELEFMLEHMALVVDKTRYFVPYKEHEWVVDVFHGENEGLVVAEIELSAEQEAFAEPSSPSLLGLVGR